MVGIEERGRSRDSGSDALESHSKGLLVVGPQIKAALDKLAGFVLASIEVHGQSLGIFAVILEEVIVGGTLDSYERRRRRRLWIRLSGDGFSVEVVGAQVVTPRVLGFAANLVQAAVRVEVDVAQGIVQTEEAAARVYDLYDLGVAFADSHVARADQGTGWIQT